MTSSLSPKYWFDKIQDSIKTDQESQEKFNVFKKDFQKRMRVNAILLAVTSIIIMGFLFFAIITMKKSYSEMQNLETKIEGLQTELEECEN